MSLLTIKESQSTFLQEATDSPPPEETQIDELVTRVARKNIMRAEDIDRKQMSMLKDKLFDEETAIRVSEKITNSEIRLCFDGRYLQDILQNGYAHWSQLSVSANTSGPKLFIQRLETDINVFGVKYYNKNILIRAINEFHQNPILFIQEWNERFNTSYSLKEDSDYQALVQKMLDDQLTLNDRHADYNRGPIFGSLFHENKLLDPSDGHRTGPAPDMSAIYAKSQIVLRPELRNRATFVLGDSFDAYPNTYAWKNSDSKTRDSILFTFTEKQEDQNILNRLRTAYKDSVNYIECQMYQIIEPQHIQMLRISISECPTIEQRAAQITRQYGVPIEIIP